MSTRSFSRAGITRRLFNTPLAVMPATAAIVLGAVGPRFDVSQLLMHAGGEQLGIEELVARAGAERDRIEAKRGLDSRAPGLPAGEVLDIQEGVAHINIRGELVSENGGGVAPSSGFTGYDAIGNAWAIAQRDGAVRGILLDIDSPGGEVVDLMELTRRMMSDRGRKPTRAIIRGAGCSAAYAIAACCDEITVQDLGFAGSIGVIAMHADFSSQLEQSGVKVTLITAGAHKADGNPFEALPEAVRADFQRDIDAAYGRFVAHIAKARKMPVSAVRATEARVYRGEEAVAAGLVDKVMGWADSQAEFVAAVNGRSPAKSPGARSSASQASMETIMPGEPDSNSTSAASALVGITKLAVLGSAAHATALAAALTAAGVEGIAVEAVDQVPGGDVGAAATDERTRVLALVDLCAETTMSAPLRAAIEGGTEAGAFAISLAQAAKARGASMSDLRAGAVQDDQLPAPAGKGAVAGSNGAKKPTMAQRVAALGHRGLAHTLKG